MRDQIDSVLAQIAHGWCTEYKAHQLADLIVKERLLYCVEIGVFTGRSLLPMALAVKELNCGGFVLGIDPYNHEINNEGGVSDDHDNWSAGVPYNKFFADTVEWIEKLQLQSHCGLLKCNSADCASIIGPIDLLHIDGCHSVLSSCRDVEIWYPKVQIGGLIVLDDSNWASVQEARKTLQDRCGNPITEPNPGAWEIYRRID